MTIRTLIVDDEAPARTRLRQLLHTEPDFELLGECGNGRQAVEFIRTNRLDLVFLDIQMPQLNGLDVCRQIGREHLPWVIFVTAFDRFALDAFELHAVDYLLKPFDQARFVDTLNRIRSLTRHTRRDSVEDRLWAALDRIQLETQAAERLAFRADGRIFFLKPAEIDWIEADANYVKIHAAGSVHHVRETLQSLEKPLPKATFMRISRSAIVNLDRIRDLQPLFYGAYSVHMKDGARFTLSRNYRDRLEEQLRERKPH
jgi:two-component system, LytTR family, response regulator